jgi:Tol biopolymer transport system component
VQVESGSEKPISTHKFVEVGQVAWLPNGTGLLMSAADQRPNPSQIYYLSYPGGELRKVTNDLNNYYAVSLTADLNTLVAVQHDVLSRVWIAPSEDTSRAKQITSGKVDGADGICWTPDDRLVYQSTAGGSYDLWIMDADGSNQKQLTGRTGVQGSAAANVARGSPSVSRDGRYIVFRGNSTGSFDIWRMDRNGDNLKQLTTDGAAFSPACSPDGQWVVYTSNSSGKDTLLRVGINGGEPLQLTDKPSPHPAISPDGKLIACYYGDERSNSPWKLALIPFEGGQPAKLLDVPATVNLDTPIKWTPDGRAVVYGDTRNGISNIWSQPVDGGPPKQLTNFNTDGIVHFDWSRDGKQLACSRGNEISDIILMSNSK